MATYEAINLIHNRSLYPTPNANPSPLQQQYSRMFAITDDYLLTYPRRNAWETASHLVQPINEQYMHGEYDNSRLPNHPETQMSCRMLFGIILDLIIQIPHGHQYQILLADLVRAIQNHPDVYDRYTWRLSTTYGAQSWNVLSLFRQCVHEYWSLGPVDWCIDSCSSFVCQHKPKLRDNPHYVRSQLFDEIYARHGSDVPLEDGDLHYWSREEFMNLNAFVAKLMVRETSNVDVLAISTFRAAFETPLSWQTIRDILPSASMYIRYSGKHIYSLCQQEFLPGKDDELFVGQLYNGPEGFCRRRWSFWKERSAKVSEEDKFGSDTSDTAREIVWLMEEIEKERYWIDAEESMAEIMGEYTDGYPRQVVEQDEEIDSDHGSDTVSEGSAMDISEGESVDL